MRACLALVVVLFVVCLASGVGGENNFSNFSMSHSLPQGCFFLLKMALLLNKLTIHFQSGQWDTFIKTRT